MAHGRESFQNAAEWEKKYRPIKKSGGIRTRCGGTLFDRFGEDRKFIDRMEREFIWSVFHNGAFEYIQSGKQNGDQVVGYIVTDYPVLFVDKDALFAIDYEKIDWNAFETAAKVETTEQAVEKKEVVSPSVAKVESPVDKPKPVSEPVKKEQETPVKAPEKQAEPKPERVKKAPTPEASSKAEEAAPRLAGAAKMFEKVFGKVKPKVQEAPALATVEPAPARAVPVQETAPAKAATPTTVPPAAVKPPALPEPALPAGTPVPPVPQKVVTEVPVQAPVVASSVPVPPAALARPDPPPQAPPKTASSETAVEDFQLVPTVPKTSRPPRPVRPQRGPKPKPVQIPATPPPATPAADPRPAPPQPKPAVIRILPEEIATPKPVAIPISAPAATPAADPRPAPPPPAPTVMRISPVEAAKPKPVVIPASAPAATPAAEPKPAPPPPAPTKRKVVTRYLPIGRDQAKLDLQFFGLWPNGVLCKQCGGSGYFAGVQIGLLECEGCDGRGWNPRAGTPLEYEVVLD